MNIRIISLLFFCINILIAETIDFISANPFSFRDIILYLDSQDKQEVSGILQFPDDNNFKKKYPLIIGVAGSLGWREHHSEQLKMYREMGIATFELHSFKSRGVESTVGTQTSVTTAMMILDSYRALDILSEHDRIDQNKIAITGWSLGGGTTLFSAWQPLIDAIKPENRFSAHLSYYPPCIVQPDDLNFSDAPIHILIGEKDNWTTAAACVDFVDAVKINKKNIGITVFKDSHHSFDSSSEIKIAENGYNLTECKFKMRNDGTVLMNFLNIPMITPMLQKIGLGMCAGRGTTFGGNVSARIEALSFSKIFMTQNLLNN